MDSSVTLNTRHSLNLFNLLSEKMETLLLEAGYSVENNVYIMRETINKKEKLCVPRVFLQGKFRKCDKEKDDEDKIRETTSDSKIDSETGEPNDLRTSNIGLIKSEDT